jgi:phosphate transport system substrate-binding protein
MQIADLYSGRTEAWPDGTRIRLVLRPVGDGDSQQIRKMTPAIGEGLTHAEGCLD